MEFSKFRQNGELSDITVVVDGRELRLHKFPLFAKSDYFCMVARNNLDGFNRVELENFPGGAQMFETVADFCYNMNVDVSSKNVVRLRCAADFLQMTGPGNLVDTTEKCLHDLLTSAKLSRSPSGIMELLSTCDVVGPASEHTGIVKQCLDALVDCWLNPPTKFTSPRAKSYREDENENVCAKSLQNLPLEWFAKVLSIGKEKGVRVSKMAEIAQIYISIAMGSVGKEGKDNKDNDTPADGYNVPKELTKDLDLLQSAIEMESSSMEACVETNKPHQKDISEVLDKVLLELPDDAPLADYVTSDWITKALNIATANGCACKMMLIKTAGEIFRKLSMEELSELSPSVMHDIIREISSNSEADKRESFCKLVDDYLQHLAGKRELTSDTFRLLVSTVPEESRATHDSLYLSLEAVFLSEHDTLTNETHKELLDTIDFSRLNEKTLQKALEGGHVPAEHVAKAALSLCSTLRTELESVKCIAKIRDEELQKAHQTNATSDSSLDLSDLDGCVIPNRSGSAITETDKSRYATDTRHYRKDRGEREKLEPHTSVYMGSSFHNSLRKSDVRGLHDPLPTRHKHLSAYTYRPISSDHDSSYADELDYKFDRSFRSLENLRTARTAYPSSCSHRSYTHRF